MFTVEEKRILWVIGSLEKLSHFGLISESSIRITDWDSYFEIDDMRKSLISKEDIIPILFTLIFEGMEIENVDAVYQLLIDYYENRSELFSYGMNRMVIG